MTRVVFWFVVLSLAAINWAALHDILKGEANVWMEWSVVAVSALLLAVYLIGRLSHPG
jgi:hypothetical protein